MGIIRTFLAISVVFAHSLQHSMILVGGRNAVQLFYIISGFLISFILVEKRSYNTALKFYLNRFLRLYPTYFFVAIITLLFNLSIKSNFFELYNHIPSSAETLLIVSNIFLFGQDWVMFFAIDNGKLIFSSDFNKSDELLYLGLIVPQAWTLGVELSFYLIAPFILPHKKTTFILLFLSILIRIFLIKQGIGFKDPWTYRFFPSELSLFLIGSLAHQTLTPMLKKITEKKMLFFSNTATTFMMLFISMYPFFPITESTRSLIMFFIFTISMPFLFFFQNKNELDKKIGALSYPIYISHLFIISLVNYESINLAHLAYTLKPIAILFLTIIFSLFINTFIEKKVDNFRLNFRHTTST
ncbi:acyltransferase family protein [Methylomonas methanica]|nr:acyltransferase [Methylomonas methanica]